VATTISPISLPEWWENLLIFQERYDLSKQELESLVQYLIEEATFIDAGHRNVHVHYNWRQGTWTLEQEKVVLGTIGPDEDPQWVISLEEATALEPHCLPADFIRVPIPWPSFSIHAETQVKQLLMRWTKNYEDQLLHRYAEQMFHTLQRATAITTTDPQGSVLQIGRFTTVLTPEHQGHAGTSAGAGDDTGEDAARANVDRAGKEGVHAEP